MSDSALLPVPAPARDPRLSAVAVPGALAVLAIGVLVTILAVWSTDAADEVSLARQHRVVSQLLDREIESVAHQQESSTVWDDAVVHLKGPFDPDWIDANVGLWMALYFGHDRTFVLDDHDRPLYASRGAERGTPAEYGLVDAAARPLVQRLRAVLASGTWASTDPRNRSPGAADLATVDGHPAFVSVKPVMPWGGTLKQAPGTEYLHISVRYLDGTFITDLRDRFAFDGARFSPEPPADAAESASPLRSGDGGLLGYFVWKPFRPGHVVLGHLVPALVLALAGIGGVVALLVARLRRGARALAASEALARHLAFHDPLTGLPNRALFTARLDGLIAAGQTFALLLIDLDRFKAINDGLGHPAGDAVLRGIGERFRREAGAEATLARLGGDEFAVLVPGAPAEATGLGERLVTAARQPLRFEGRSVATGASVGLALWPRDGAGAADLCRNADAALYRAKALGRGALAEAGGAPPEAGAAPARAA